MMNVMNRMRLYHALLAVLAVAAYLTGEIRPYHAWLGYGVAGVIVLRLLWASGGERQAGLMRFYPEFEGLKLRSLATHPAISRALMLAIALSLLTVTGTGIAMDQGRAFGPGPPRAERAAAEPDARGEIRRREAEHRDDDAKGEGKEHGKDGPLSEVHETAGTILLVFVGLHVAYLLAFKRPLAKFMLFLPRTGRKKPAPPAST